MGVDPKILQQYVDKYEEDLAKWKRQASKYGKAVKSYNAEIDTYKNKTQPELQRLADAYNNELKALNDKIANYNNNLGDSNRGYWDNYIAEARKLHYANANSIGGQMRELEKTMPKVPTAVNALFNENLYLQNNPDVAQAVANGQFKSGLEHYLQSGYKENRNAASGNAQNEKTLREAAAWQASTNAEFEKYMAAVDQSRYIGTNAEALARAGTPAINEALKGYASPADIENATSLVNAAYKTYLGRSAEASGLNFWISAITGGSQTPQQLVNSLQQSAEGKTYAANQIAPVTSAMSSFLSGGQNIFDEKYYLANNPDVAAAVAKGQIASGLQHYQQFGVNEGRKTAQTIFNEQYYLANNPDVAQAVAQGKFQSGLQHYQSTGYKEGRKAYAVNPQTADAIVKAAYQSYLGRSPDTAGLNYWASAIKNGENPQTVLDNIQASQESKTYTNSKIAPLNAALDTYKTNEYTQDTKNLIAATFKTYLGREPDESGLNFWTNEVTSGRTSPQALVDSLRQSQEAVAFGGKMVDTQAQVDAANKLKADYEALQKDRPGLDWFAGQKTPGRVTNAMATGDPAKIVQATYSAYLGRQPETEGLNFWTKEIADKKLTPQQAVNAIRKSEEGSTYATQYHGVAPSFTQKQMDALQGQQTLAQQERSKDNQLGLVQRAQGARQADSIVGGILQSARYST